MWYGSGALANQVRDVPTIGTVKTVLEDREGNVWLAEQDAVVHRVRRPSIVTLNDSASVNGASPPTSLAVDRADNVWAARSFTSLISDAVDGVWKVDAGGLKHVQAGDIRSATAITRDWQGSVWAAGREGVWRLTGQRFLKVTELPGAWLGEYVKGLTVDSSGGLWLSVRGVGLVRYDGATWQSSVGVYNLPANAPTAQASDSSGNVWLGYADGTVARLDGNRAEIIGQERGLQVGAVTVISPGLHTVVAGVSGVALLVHGHFVLLNPSVPAFDGITGIVEASNGDIWINSDKGIVHIDSAALVQDVSKPGVLDVPVQLFDVNDGYPTPSFAVASANPLTTIVQTSNGRIWLAARGGVGWLDPAQVRKPAVAPHVMIKSLIADGKLVDSDQKERLPAGTRNVEIDYTAPSFTHPERLQYRYRLEGVEESWIEAGARQRAPYSNLGPGVYRFVVDVTNDSGLWTGNPASLDIVIPPTFAQSKLFVALCVAGTLLLLGLAHSIRIRQLQSRQRRLLDERLGERERIARELHDTLLQGTQALIIKVHQAAKLSRGGEQNHDVLEQALARADRIVAEGRDRIQDLRGPIDADPDLATALAAIGDEIAGDHAASFEVVVKGRVRAMTPSAMSEGYRIGREAILNAFHHAQARSIDVEVVYGDQDVCVCVRDDGVGIDSGAAEGGSAPGHWGLPGMRERARRIGATLDIRRQLEGGTEIEFRIPATVAYMEPKRRSRWWSPRTGAGDQRV